MLQKLFTSRTRVKRLRVFMMKDKRPRRGHATIYTTTGTISEKEAEKVVERAEKLIHKILRMLTGDNK